MRAFSFNSGSAKYTLHILFLSPPFFIMYKQKRKKKNLIPLNKDIDFSKFYIFVNIIKGDRELKKNKEKIMYTNEFETKSLFIERNHLRADGYWQVALDIGYSGVKGMSPNAVFSFPSFARKFTGEMLKAGSPDPKDIQYKADGEIWNVGYTAQSTLSQGDTNDGLASLFGRNRYFSPMFLVLARTGLALGTMETDYGNPNGKKLVLQTGLPPAYLKQDASLLKEALSGEHNFEVRIGNGPWRKFSFTLNEDDIKVMSQPMGSLLSKVMNSEGKRTAESDDYFSKNILILDGGFGTIDIFSIKRRVVESTQSFDNLGMKKVFEETTKEIFEKYGVDIPVHAFQKALRDGYITKFNRKERKTEDIPFEDILKKSSEKVCKELLGKIDTMYDNLIDYDYLLITGGTGSAWEDMIKDYYKGMNNLTIIDSKNEEMLPAIFNNVRGYYLYITELLRKKTHED